jgi:citrate lyase subunit beta/citryl-CoA lyase
MMSQARTLKLRALLFAPADSARKVEKAIGLGADAVILDLEDSVAPVAKRDARETAITALREHPDRLIIRINPRETGWYLDDVAETVVHRPAAILLPKCAGPADLLALSHQIDVLEASAGLPAGQIGILALATETAASLASMDYVSVTPRLRGLCFGAEDLSADLGIVARRKTGEFAAPVAAARNRVLIAAAAAGVPAIDTPFPDPRNPQGLLDELESSVTDGFSGKLCIHPSQVSVVQDAFTPSADRIAWARDVRRLLEGGDGAGVAILDGKMVDIAHLKLARRVLTMADQD